MDEPKLLLFDSQISRMLTGFQSTTEQAQKNPNKPVFPGKPGQPYPVPGREKCDKLPTNAIALLVLLSKIWDRICLLVNVFDSLSYIVVSSPFIRIVSSTVTLIKFVGDRTHARTHVNAFPYNSWKIYKILKMKNEKRKSSVFLTESFKNLHLYLTFASFLDIKFKNTEESSYNKVRFMSCSNMRSFELWKAAVI